MIDTGRWTDAQRLLAEVAEIAVVRRFRCLAADIAALQMELTALRTPPCGRSSPA